jgi:ribosomal protein S18 acetylase RimI-like enzyme
LGKVEIYQAQVEDASTILQIQKEAYISEAELNNDFQIPPLTQTLDELEDEFNHKLILKVMINDEIVGSGQAKLMDSTCHIGRMALRSHVKGMGIGSKLLSKLERFFSEAKRVELFTGAQSKANLAMYIRRGYKPFKEDVLGKTNVVYLEKVLTKANT